MTITYYEDVGRVLCRLMGPLVEVVIHDLATDKIIFIEGSLSKRKIGDPSLLDEIKDFDELAQTVYTKLNFDGRLLKSISLPIKEKNKVIALLCINYDVTLFKDLGELATTILAKPFSKKPEVLFKNDWQDRINEFMHIFLKENNLQFAALTNKDKKKIVESLYEKGAFTEKNAADYIAKILAMSRATIFNYLRKCKENNHEA